MLNYLAFPQFYCAVGIMGCRSGLTSLSSWWFSMWTDCFFFSQFFVSDEYLLADFVHLFSSVLCSLITLLYHSSKTLDPFFLKDKFPFKSECLKVFHCSLKSFCKKQYYIWGVKYEPDRFLICPHVIEFTQGASVTCGHLYYITWKCYHIWYSLDSLSRCVLD